jgi:hypothetical protein
VRPSLFLLGIGNGGIGGITSGGIPLGLEELRAHNTYPVFGVCNLGFGVWGLATEDFGFGVCGRNSFVFEAEAEAEAEAKAEAEPPRSPSGFGFRAKPCSDRRRRRFFWLRVWGLGLRLWRW